MGRQSQLSEMGSGRSAEVTGPARNSLRRQRRASYGSPSGAENSSRSIALLPHLTCARADRQSLSPSLPCLRIPSSSLLDCPGRVRRVKAKPHAVASRALTRRPQPEGWQLSRRTGEDQGMATSTGRTAVRRAISGPLTPVTSGLSRSLADTLPRRSGHVTGPDGTDSQADSSRTRQEGSPRGLCELPVQPSSTGARLASVTRVPDQDWTIPTISVKSSRDYGLRKARSAVTLLR
jgi:hypothetical protein